MLQNLRFWKIFALLFPAGILIGLYAYIGSFSRLMGDDYCLLYNADRFGVFRSIWYWYLNWHGGFSASFTDSLLVIFGEKGMWLFVPASLLLWLGTTSFSFGMVLQNSLDRRYKIFTSLALGSVLIVVVLLWSPDIQQSLFWWAGLRKYVFPLVVASLYPGIYVWFIQKNRPKRETILWSVFSFIILFFVGGFSETFTTGQVALLFFVVSLRLVTNKLNFRDNSFTFLFSGLLGAVTALLIMAIAPGNSVRQGFFPPPPALFMLLKIASTSYIDFLMYIPKSLIISAAFVGAILGAINLGMDTNHEEPPKLWSICVILIAGLVIPLASFLPFAYVASEPLVGRAMINPAYLFAAIFLYAAVQAGKWLTSKIKPVTRPRVFLGLTIVTFALITVSVWKYGQEFYYLGRAPIEYAEQWERSHEAIIHAKQAGDEIITIPVAHNWAGVLGPNDNPKYYVNQCMSRYYGIQIFATETLDN